MALPKIPYGGFSPVRLQGRYIRLGLPVRRSLRVARFASVLHAPRCMHLIPVLCRGTVRAEASPFEQPLLLYPRGPRSETGSVVPLHLHLSGPIRPTRRHIPISPRSRLIPDAFAVHITPRRPSSGSTLSLSFLPDMPSSTTPGRSQPVCSRHAVPT